MRSNETIMRLQKGAIAKTEILYQYDYGQKLLFTGVDLPETFEVHFSNQLGGESKTAIGSNAEVLIPDEYFLSGASIYVWIYLHDGEDDGETEYHGIINIARRAKPTDQEPTPVQQDVITQAIAALNTAVTEAEGIRDAIPETVNTALAEAKASGEFDGEDGKDGQDGQDGKDGADGYTPQKGVDYFDGEPGKDGSPGADGISPSITITDITGGHRVTITDATGAHSFDVMDGSKGDPGNPGQPGADGLSPTATVTKSGKVATISITDKNGTTTETVSDGEDADPTELIDDTSTTATDKVWSAKKSADEVSDLNSALNDKLDSPETAGTSGQVLTSDGQGGQTWETPSGGDVTDVQVNGTSVLQDGVANVPIGDNTNPGVFRTGVYGVGVYNYDATRLCVKCAQSNQIKAGSDAYMPIVPGKQHESAFYGLAKAAGADMASVSGATVGVYPEAQKIAIQKMLGIYQAPWELIRGDTGANAESGNIEIAVDGNGEEFELTDIRLVFHTPTQETEASVANPGRIKFFFSSNLNDTLYIGTYKQAAGAAGRTSYFNIEQHDGMIERTYNKNVTNNGEQGIIAGINANLGGLTRWEKASKTYIKILIEGVTGTWLYKLYGKRKWN